MLRLRDIMTADVVTVRPDTSLRDAMELLASRHLSGAPVVAGNRVVGVVSSTDLMALAAALPGVPSNRPDPDPAPWGDLADAAEPDDERENEVPAASYFAELWAEVESDTSERMAATTEPDWDVLGDHTVDEAMTRAVYSLPPDADVLQAADFMRRVHAHRVLVMSGDELLGIVTAMDVTSAVADHRLSTRTYVFDRNAAPDDRR